MSIYFIQPEGEPAVKIGQTGNVPARLSALQMAHHKPLAVIAIMPGGGKEEAALHARFATQRRRGEWFRLDDEIAAFLETVAKPRTPWQMVNAIAGELFAAIKADLAKRDLSVADVAAKHGIATSTIYYLFPGGRKKVQLAKVRETRKALKKTVHTIESIWQRKQRAPH